jgi:hypothetical protein
MAKSENVENHGKNVWGPYFFSFSELFFCIFLVYSASARHASAGLHGSALA